MKTALKSIFALLTLIVVAAGVVFLPAVFAEEDTVRVDPWEFTLPVSMPRKNWFDNTCYRKEFDDPDHTLIFAVDDVQSFSCTGEGIDCTSPNKVAVFGKTLNDLLRARQSRMGGRDGRVVTKSAKVIPAKSTDNGSVCGALHLLAEDVGVPGYEDQLFTMISFSIICLDFVQNSEEFDSIEFGFSERYRLELGHEPLADLEALAETLIQSVRFNKS